MKIKVKVCIPKNTHYYISNEYVKGYSKTTKELWATIEVEDTWDDYQIIHYALYKYLYKKVSITDWNTYAYWRDIDIYEDDVKVIR